MYEPCARRDKRRHRLKLTIDNTVVRKRGVEESERNFPCESFVVSRRNLFLNFKKKRFETIFKIISGFTIYQSVFGNVSISCD